MEDFDLIERTDIDSVLDGLDIPEDIPYGGFDCVQSDFNQFEL